jgi:hypothetical protein
LAFFSNKGKNKLDKIAFYKKQFSVLLSSKSKNKINKSQNFKAQLPNTDQSQSPT